MASSFFNILSIVSTRQTIIDFGYPNCGAGWFDVQHQGVCNDYCRWVGSCGCRGKCSWWSCALAGLKKAYTDKGVYQEAETATKNCQSNHSLYSKANGYI